MIYILWLYKMKTGENVESSVIDNLYQLCPLHPYRTTLSYWSDSGNEHRSRGAIRALADQQQLQFFETGRTPSDTRLYWKKLLLVWIKQ